MTAQEWLDRADALAQAATEGPWVASDASTWHNPSVLIDGADPETASDNEWVAEAGPWKGNGLADAVFIAACRSLLPQAVAALRAVLDLHRPIPMPIGHECAKCGELLNERTPNCPTVQVIVDAGVR